ncbi:MAG: YbhB/YbcL family Raf kinase inhibitor-like protein [Herminiimonas sp.]|nr:YbhB/YbcL family Raf kinase inhibitor-like protein [Herminiimonas sp.]
MSMTLTSPAFNDGAGIPAKYTCDGEEISPPLAWSGAPPAARSLALIVEDPDAPDPAAPKVTWVHWILYNIPPDTNGLKEGAASHALPAGALEGNNSWHRTGYGGPCPPIGRHRYFFRLYALDTVLHDLAKPDRERMLREIEGKVIAQAQLLGVYQRKR